jgi:hypothetical protein
MWWRNEDTDTAVKARALAEALTIAEVGRLSVYRYYDTVDESVNGVLRKTNRAWNLVPDDWYELPHGWYPNLYSYFIRRLTRWVHAYLSAGWTIEEIIIYWGLSGRRPNRDTLRMYVKNYPGELERRTRLYNQRLAVNLK